MFFPALLVAQQDSTLNQPLYGDHVSVRFTFDVGITNVRPAALNQHLFGNGGFDQLMTMGLGEGMSIEPLNEKGYFGYDATWSFHWYFAEKRNETDVSGDKIEYKLDGWELMTSIWCVDLFANRNFDLLIGGGTYWGNLKLYQTNISDSTAKKVYKNPFVAPMARAELRLNLSIITLGGRFSYRYDITNDIWQRKSDGLNPLPGYRFRDMQFMFFIGFRGPFV